MWLSNVGTIPRLEVWKKGSWQQAGEQVKQGLKRRLTCSSFFYTSHQADRRHEAEPQTAAPKQTDGEVPKELCTWWLRFPQTHPK